MTDVFLARQWSDDTPSEPDLFAWFGDPADPGTEEYSIDVAHKALDRIARMLKSKGAAIQRTPTGAGMSLLLHKLPHSERWPFRWYPLHDDLQMRIRANMPGPCVQFIAQDSPVDEIFLYDARLAYLSTAEKVPCYIPALMTNSDDFRYAGYVQHDEQKTYAGPMRGFYHIDVTVPPGWNRIGLAPKKRKHHMHPDYPRTPGEEFESWLTNYEVYLLQKWGWTFAIRERILFHNDNTQRFDPLKNWKEEFARFFEVIGDPRNEELRLLRHALRAMALNTIGYFNARSSEMRTIPAGQAVPDDIPDHADATPQPGGGWCYSWATPHKNLMAMWNHPEWYAAIIGRWRYKVLCKALECPPDDILGIYTDGIYTAAPVASWGATEPHQKAAVGSFRVKQHAIASVECTPQSWDDLFSELM